MNFKIPFTFFLLVASFQLFAQCENDTIPPIVVSDDLTVSCTLELDDLLPPMITDNCDDAPVLELIDEQTEDEGICDEGTVITRTYTATDESGNSVTFDINILFVRDYETVFPDDVTWTSEQFAANPQLIDALPLNPDLTVTGSGEVPDFIYCNYAVSFTDEIISSCNASSFHLQRSWTVLDWCTNSLITTDNAGNDNIQDIYVGEQNTAPDAVCNSIVVELFPVDADNDGMIDNCIIEIWASDLASQSSDDTTPPTELQFWADADLSDPTFFLTTEHVGENNLTVYVEDGNGCFSTCESIVIVEDSPDCPDYVPPVPNISGMVETQNGEGIKDVEIIIGTSTLFDVTDSTGTYGQDLPEGVPGAFVLITASKDVNPDNGVTAADLIIMRKHILTTDLIENPVYLLAADVNNSGTITTADLVATRSVILNIVDGFPNSESWRFFITEFFPEDILPQFFFELSASGNIINFTGYKVGDVNGTANPQQ